MRARYAGAVLAAMLIAAIAVGQTSSRARISAATGSGTVSSATAPLVVTGSDIAMPPASASQSGYLNLVGSNLVIDAGFVVRGTGAIVTTTGTGASTVGVDLTNSSSSGYTGIIYNNESGSTAVFTGFGNSASTAPAEFRVNNIAASGTIAFKINSVDALKITNASTIVSGTEYVSFSVAPNALLAATTLGGAIIGPQAFTVTGISPFVATQAVTTAATLVFTISDGTNTCTGTFTCDGTGIASLQGTGPKRVTTANGAGTGCVYAASAALTLSVSTQGCGTAPIVNNINVVGKWQ